MIGRLIARLLGLAPRTEARRAAPLPPETRRVHLFSGTLGSEAEAMGYVMPPMEGPVADAPAPLTVDLPEAFLDPAHVYMGYGSGAEPLLERFFADEMLLDVRHITAGADTVVVIDEAAMGGFPFVLQDTPRLTYHGPFELPAPAAR
ncbi:hypothetical protein [Vannielia litorea]|uniref:hypothetical protein n=1 Tax=Vannielia litorea TaxID=1217970 RepID=UPI001C962344|nr:hypothetical protein [Vannielia litorea]MBY6048247.1 hypothetical protein [Vannielia litorea]MBY6075661.1 hypothetical protein [Vannielia litorea]